MGTETALAEERDPNLALGSHEAGTEEAREHAEWMRESRYGADPLDRFRKFLQSKSRSAATELYKMATRQGRHENISAEDQMAAIKMLFEFAYPPTMKKRAPGIRFGVADG
jgi:nitroimidazol reductase NimA-like FMN-containing flavoprotein (pyridoxamine 5'-phosphate oxidase superfamily)